MRGAAALSFYLTSTLFPLLIILYTLLGSSPARMEAILRVARGLMAAESASVIEDFLEYVARNNSRAMMMAAFLLLLSSASAAMRTMQAAIGELQGETRYRGLKNVLFSLILSLLFVAALYFAILVMLTGESFFARLGRSFRVFDLARLWQLLRYPALGAAEYAIIFGLYSASLPEDARYPVGAGALAAALALVGVSLAYSAVIGASARYPLVYGSLASFILLMMWLHTCCIVVLSGAALNVAVRDLRRGRPKSV